METVREYVAVWPLQLAVRVTVTVPLIVPAVAVNPALVAPDGITTATGVVTTELLLLSPIVNPPRGAAAVSATIHWLVPAEPMLPGEQFKLESAAAAGSMVRVAVTVELPKPAVRIELC